MNQTSAVMNRNSIGSNAIDSPRPSPPGITDTANTLYSDAQAIRARLQEYSDRLLGSQPEVPGREMSKPAAGLLGVLIAIHEEHLRLFEILNRLDGAL